MKPGQKGLGQALAAIAGLEAFYPDPTVRDSAALINSGISNALVEILGEEQAHALFDAVIAELNPELEAFGIKIATTRGLQADAAKEAGELLSRVAKGSLS